MFGSLVPLLQSMPILNLIAAFVLCLSPGTRTRIFVPEKCCLPWHGPHLQSHPPPSHYILLPTTLGWLHSHLTMGV